MLIEQLFGKKKLTGSEKQIVDFIEANPRIVRLILPMTD